MNSHIELTVTTKLGEYKAIMSINAHHVIKLDIRGKVTVRGNDYTVDVPNVYYTKGNEEDQFSQPHYAHTIQYITPDLSFKSASAQAIRADIQKNVMPAFFSLDTEENRRRVQFNWYVREYQSALSSAEHAKQQMIEAAARLGMKDQVENV